MSILSYKYKAHKFINYAFYVVVFIVGFLLGFASDKINYNKLINQVLMIDNVYAYPVNSGEFNITNIEEYSIENIPSSWKEEFNLEDYPYVLIFQAKSTIKIYFFDNINNLSVTANSSYISITHTANNNYARYTINSDSSYSDIGGISKESNAGAFGIGYFSWSTNNYYTNFDITKVSSYSNTSGRTDDSLNQMINVLDFSQYALKLEFNENLFKDNPDFKEVCVDNNTTIAITRTDNPENLEYMTDYDYIWFPYKPFGLISYNYHNADLLNKDNTDILGELNWSSDNVFLYENYSPIFFKDKETIDETFNDEIVGGNLEFKGYSNKYSYYGWSSALFNVWFDYRDGNNFNFFPIFEFENITKLYINDSSGTIHGGGGNRLDGDEEIELSKQYCFYIKKEYSVTEVYKNEFNDVQGNVPTQNGDFNFTTSLNKNNINTGDFLSQPKSFITSMKDTINLINSLIYEFYLSLPLLLRTFIITLLVLLLIMLIMKIGGYN